MSKIEKYIKRFSALITIVALMGLMVPYQSAQAGELENEKDVMTRLKASTLSSHNITFNLSTGNAFNAGETITVDFGEDDGKFVVDGAASVIADFDFNDGTERTIYNVTTSTADCTGSTGANDISVGINDTTGVVTFLACPSFTPSAAGATINIKYGTAATVDGTGTNRVTNPAAGNNIVIYLGGTVGDTGSLAVSILSDDQVSVTATVDPNFTFTISTTTCNLGTLSTAAVNSCSYTATTTSNSEDGYATTIVEDGNLRDGPNDIDDTVGDVNAGNEEYGFRTSGTDGQYNTVDEPITSTPKIIALDTTGPINAQAITVTHKASINALTIAGSYSHIVTLVSTGTF